MECYKPEQERDLTDAKYWKPIYSEIKKILEQREVLRANVCAVGVK
jgi:hypothetical protein